MLHICYAFSDTDGSYHHYALTALTSVFENTGSRVCAHLLVEESFKAEAREAFHRLAARYGQSVLFHDVPDVPPAVLKNVRAIFGKGTLFRLHIPELIREERLLYLDCDTICTMDIQEVFAMGAGDAAIAGAPDVSARNNPVFAAYLRGIGLFPAQYVNAGVLLMDLNKMRERHPDYAPAILAILAEKRLLYPDQDAMHLFFQQRGVGMSFLPERCNFLMGYGDRAYLDRAEYENKILHYTRDKPWRALYPGALMFWGYWALCHSPEEALAGMAALDEHEHARLHRFILRDAGARGLLRRVYDLRRQGLWRSIADRVMPSRRKRASP